MHMKLIMTSYKIILSDERNANLLLKKWGIFELSVLIDIFEISLSEDVFWNLIESECICIYSYIQYSIKLFGTNGQRNQGLLY
jgi:hypothetical protein